MPEFITTEIIFVVLLFTLLKALGYLPLAWGIHRLSEKGLRSWIGLGISRALLGQCVGWALYYGWTEKLIIPSVALPLFFMASWALWMLLLCRQGFPFLPSIGVLALACAAWSMTLNILGFIVCIILTGHSSS